MEWWLNVSFVEVDDLIPIARAAEEAGFAGLSLGDHLVFPQTIASKYPYSSDGAVRWSPATHWPDPWVAIAAMAASTRTLRFTTGVFIAPLRDPFALGKALSTASRLSGGRVIGGFGAGWMKEEFDLVNEPFEARGGRMDEMIDVLRKLWTGEMVEHHGKFYDFPPLQMTPPPTGHVPLYFGGHNPAALRRAVRNEGWIAVHHHMDETVGLIGKIREVQQREAPERPPCAVMINALRATVAEVERFRDLGVQAVVVPALGLPGERGLAGRLDAIRRAGDNLRAGQPPA